MTLEEKVSQMMSRTPHDLKRFSIPGYEWSGMSAHNTERGEVNTVFPHAIAQAATWDPALVQRIGTAISDEARALFHSGSPRMGLTFWAPVVELARDPRWGRTHECYGEDPLLTSEIAGAWVRGIQGSDPYYLKCIAAPKHFVANNEEWDRHNGSSDIDTALLRDYYLKPYEVLVRRDHAMGIMAAYNALNGVPCIANRWLLTDILRGEWGFTGTVVTDCNGIKDLFTGHHWVDNAREAIITAINAGTDIECGNYFKEHLLWLAQHDLVTEQALDTAVRRILLSRFMLGLYDPQQQVPYTCIPSDVVDGPQHRSLARQAAREAIILLKNENDLLPLDTQKIRTLAVIGPLANVALLGGYTGKYSHAVSPLEGMRNVFGAGRILYEKGTEVKITLPPVPAELLLPPPGKGEGHGLLGEYFADTSFSGTPVFTRIDTTIDFNFGKDSPVEGLPKQYYSIRWTGRLVAPVTGTWYLGGDFDDILRLWFDGKKILDRSKNRNRSSVTVSLQLEKGRTYDLRIEYSQLWYKGRIRLWGGVPDPHRFDAAVAAARRADAAIVVAGIDDSVEGEGRDRSSLGLPGDQAALVRAVLAANPRTVLVLQNGGPVSLPRLAEEVPAIVETFCNGEEGGNALADVLTGRYNPAGRLPLTVYRSVQQLPDISDYDIRKGRTYMYYSQLAKRHPEAPEPLWPFGHGLSYTSFAYDRIKAERKRVAPGDSIRVRVAITNTGERDGEEVVQLYARTPADGNRRPDRRLMAFRRVPVEKGKTATVTLAFPVDDLAYWEEKKSRFIVPAGEVTLAVGSSTKEIHGVVRVRVLGTMNDERRSMNGRP
jgi:beta-glucosidase